MISSKSAPTVAVVVPNRNDSDCLPACLNSILRQNVQPDQIVFVDDYSSDDSFEKAQQILKDAPNALLLSNSQCLGTMGALNEGMGHTSCDYVLFLSSNDFLAEGLIEKAKNSMLRLGRPGVWSAMVWEADENGKPKHIHPSPVIATNERYFSSTECIRLAKTVGNWFTGTVTSVKVV